MKNTKRYLLGGLLTGVILMLGVFIQNKDGFANVSTGRLFVNVYGIGHPTAIAGIFGNSGDYPLTKTGSNSSFTTFNKNDVPAGNWNAGACTGTRSGGVSFTIAAVSTTVNINLQVGECIL